MYYKAKSTSNGYEKKSTTKNTNIPVAMERTALYLCKKHCESANSQPASQPSERSANIMKKESSFSLALFLFLTYVYSTRAHFKWTNIFKYKFKSSDRNKSNAILELFCTFWFYWIGYALELCLFYFVVSFLSIFIQWMK